MHSITYLLPLLGVLALVGAPFEDDVGISRGAAYVFRRQGGTWIEQEKLLPAPGPWTAWFGWPVAVDGDRAVVAAYGQDQQSGAVYAFAGLSGTDCNGNATADGCEIVFGKTSDLNGNGIPDECECPWDCGDGDGIVGVVDFLTLLNQWGMSGTSCDFNGAGVGVVEFLDLLNAWGPCE